MLDLLKALPESSEWISIIAIFVALPALYCILCAAVHKDYAELFKSAASIPGYDGQRMAALQEEVKNRLYVFEMDWWMVAAVSVLFLAIFNISQLINQTQLLTIQCPPNDSIERLSKMLTEVHFGCDDTRTAPCRNFRGIFALYGVVVGLLLAFRIWWARLTAAKDLKSLYAMLPVSGKENHATIWVP